MNSKEMNIYSHLIIWTVFFIIFEIYFLNVFPNKVIELLPFLCRGPWKGTAFLATWMFTCLSCVFTFWFLALLLEKCLSYPLHNNYSVVIVLDTDKNSSEAIVDAALNYAPISSITTTPSSPATSAYKNIISQAPPSEKPSSNWNPISKMLNKNVNSSFKPLLSSSTVLKYMVLSAEIQLLKVMVFWELTNYFTHQMTLKSLSGS